MRIRELTAQGKPVKGIARTLNICPKTVRRVLDAGCTASTPTERAPSKLDRYRAVIRYKALECGWQTRAIFKELKALGFEGGETIVKEYVRQIRPKPARRPALRFETGPGVQGQVDLSPYEIYLGGVLTAVVCFSFVLAFSRWRFFFFVRHADRFTVMLGHRLAFEELGAVPGAILYDRMKQVVIAVIDGEPVLQDDFARLVGHYSFEVRVLEPGYKEGKGKVEKIFQDVEAFLKHGRFHDLDDLNAQAHTWRQQELHMTEHRTTGERPADRLLLERSQLRSLPGSPFRCEERNRAHTGKHFYVEYLRNFYSVPPQFADRWVTRCVLNGRLWVELDGETISEHTLSEQSHQYITLPEHEAAFREMGTGKKHTRKQFAYLGPAADRFAEGLDRTQGGASTYHMYKILELVTRIGRERVVDALRYATGYEAFSHMAVTRITRVRRMSGAADAIQTALHTPAAEPEKQPPNEASGQHQRPLSHYEALLNARSHNNKRSNPPHGQ